ncbi:MAG: hypothetical protein AAFW46_16660, partial [Pseudomonadota bacterium]
ETVDRASEPGEAETAPPLRAEAAPSLRGDADWADQPTLPFDGGAPSTTPSLAENASGARADEPGDLEARLDAELDRALQALDRRRGGGPKARLELDGDRAVESVREAARDALEKSARAPSPDREERPDEAFELAPDALDPDGLTADDAKTPGLSIALAFLAGAGFALGATLVLAYRGLV